MDLPTAKTVGFSALFAQFILSIYFKWAGIHQTNFLKNKTKTYSRVSSIVTEKFLLVSGFDEIVIRSTHGRGRRCDASTRWWSAWSVLKSGNIVAWSNGRYLVGGPVFRGRPENTFVVVGVADRS